MPLYLYYSTRDVLFADFNMTDSTSGSGTVINDDTSGSSTDDNQPTTPDNSGSSATLADVLTAVNKLQATADRLLTAFKTLN